MLLLFFFSFITLPPFHPHLIYDSLVSIMASHDHLASLLEDNLIINDVNSNATILGAIIAEKPLIIGGIKCSLCSAWADFGSIHITHQKKDLFTIKMDNGFLASLNSRKPFPTGSWLPLNDYTSRKVEYIYEGLHDFCYRCGRLGHAFDVCKNFRVHNPNEDQPENIWYGPWMATKVSKLPPQNHFDKPFRVHQKPQFVRNLRRNLQAPYQTKN